MRLSEATQTGEILSALANFAWYEQHREPCPPDRMPTEAALSKWLLTDCPNPDTTALVALEQGYVAWQPLPAYEAGEDSTGKLRIRIAWPATPAQLLVAKEIRYGKAFPTMIYVPLEVLHADWLKAITARPHQHPLLPLVRAWLLRFVKADRKRRALLPASMRNTRQGILFDKLPERLDHLTPIARLEEPPQAWLPTMEPPKNSIVPVLPVALYTIAGGKMTTRGQGAPITQRLFFELLMAVAYLDRQRIRQPTLTLRDLVMWIWPTGWQRGRDMPRLQRALWELDNLRIECDRALWRLIAVDRLPALNASLDDPVFFDVKHLPNSDHGPLIDRHRLRLFGLQSAPAWRAYLRMAYVWDAAKASNGGIRIYATRPAVKRGPDGVLLDAGGKPVLKRNGQPMTDWTDPRAVHLYDKDGKPLVERNPHADRVPMFGPDDLAHLGFDDKMTPVQRKNWVRLTQKALTRMEKNGAIVLEKNGEGWRILEPAPEAADLPNRTPGPT